MAKVKKNLKHERFENSNFNISYDINYDKKTVSCMLDPKSEFIESLRRRTSNVLEGNNNFDMDVYLVSNKRYFAMIEDDSEGEFKVEACKAKAYYNTVELLNNDWHNNTLKMQKFIAAKVLDASRVYTSYSSIMLKRAKGRFEKKIAIADGTIEDTTTVSIDNNSVVDKLKNVAKACKKLFTK